MNLSNKEKMVLKHLEKQEIQVIPEDLRGRFTPEMLQFTLAQLQAKGLAEYMDGAYAPTPMAQELLKKKKIAKDEIIAYGHSNITATNKTTLEITTEPDVSERTGCIVGVKADKACKDLNKLLKDFLKLGNVMKITISAGGKKDMIIGYGSPALSLMDGKSIVIRKSDSIDGKTLVIMADKAAGDLDRKLVEELKKPDAIVKIRIEPGV